MTQRGSVIFNPPPGWPTPPTGWVPPKGWKPDPAWPAPPPGWQLWIADGKPATQAAPSRVLHPSDATQPSLREFAANPPTSADDRLALLQAENAALRARLESSELTPEGSSSLTTNAFFRTSGFIDITTRLKTRWHIGTDSTT